MFKNNDPVDGEALKGMIFMSGLRGEKGFEQRRLKSHVDVYLNLLNTS